MLLKRQVLFKIVINLFILNVIFKDVHADKETKLEDNPAPEICFNWENSHYKTFDGRVYSFSSKCPYILVRDSIDYSFSVIVQDHPQCEITPSKCSRIITVYYGGEAYTLKQSEEDGMPVLSSSTKQLSIPGQYEGVTVRMSAQFIILSLDAVGLTIKWNGKKMLQVEADKSLWGRTEGLCGKLDGDDSNDMVDEYGNRYFTGPDLAPHWKVDDDCDDPAKDEDACQQNINDPRSREASNFCKSLLLTNSRLEPCQNVIDFFEILDVCRKEYCGCEDEDPKTCACETVSVYARACSFKTQEVVDWRDKNTCPMLCTGGREYKACGPPSGQPICGSSIEENEDQGVGCVEGCYCPKGTVLHNNECITVDKCPCMRDGNTYQPGDVVKDLCNNCTCKNGMWDCTKENCDCECSAVADPHYTTFDGKKYDFMGKCSYYLVKTKTFSIEAENVAWSGGFRPELPPNATTNLPSCIRSVTVKYHGHVIELKQNREVLLNGVKIVTFPYRLYGNITFRQPSSNLVQVDLGNGMYIKWDGLYSAFVGVPGGFKEKTKGLCGTFNYNQNDDFLTPEGVVETNVNFFGNKWKTSHSCRDTPDTGNKKPCDINVENRPRAEKYCAVIKSELFSPCHVSVDPTQHYENCLYDMCSCSNVAVSDCLCSTVAAYADECAKKGVKIEWRNEVKECSMNCSNGQRYQVCGNSCTSTCRDISINPDCKSQCVEGCNCPEGQTLNEEGKCVPISACKCEYEGVLFDAGYKAIKEGQLCTCTNAAWNCRPATPNEKDKNPEIDPESRCNATENMVFANCTYLEPVTCSNMHNPVVSPCTPGCRCKDGYVLDTSSKKCVMFSECPCYHEGKSYNEHDVIKNECNTCKCHGGKWECTDRQCPGKCSTWGDSHFKTFDGKHYEFQGQCDYMLAKGSLGNNSFEISIQNVQCSTLKTTCSKSVTIRIKTGEDLDLITFTREMPLPSKENLKHVTLREVGLLVVIEAPLLGLVVQWDKGTRVYVKIDSVWKGKTMGLCGNYNDNEADDFQTPSGGVPEASATIFGDSWKLQPSCLPSIEITNTCKERPARKIWATKKCEILISEVFAPCHTEVPVNIYLERCIFDTCACDQGGDCECLCTALAAYTQECNDRGIPIKWRSQELCPMQCDSRSTNYNPCVSPCPIDTCEDLSKDPVNKICRQESCTEGCAPKPCPPLHIYQNSSLSECIPVNNCPHFCKEIDGVIYREGELIEEDECHKCICLQHERKCDGQPCSMTTTTTPATPTTPSPTPTPSIKPNPGPTPTPDPASCFDPMGLDNGLMNMQQVTVSSELDKNHSKEQLKISSDKAWQPLTNTVSQFVAFDFVEPRIITGLNFKGGPDGWVQMFKIQYSQNNRDWNVILDKQGVEEQIFAGNVDENTLRTVKFDLPIKAHYLKLIPIQWHNNIQMRVEIYGCFKPYPIQGDPTTPPPCNVCPNIKYESLGSGDCRCSSDQWWNGTSCDFRISCPCIESNISYPVRSIYFKNDCSQCECQGGGVSSCTPKKCECKLGMKHIVNNNCKCICQPCPEGTALCPTSNVCLNTKLWCDGINHCSDDEKDCPTPPLPKPAICPEFECSPGYEKILVSNEDTRPTQSLLKRELTNLGPEDCPKYVCHKIPGECRSITCPPNFALIIPNPTHDKCPDDYYCYPLDNTCTVSRKTVNTFDGTLYSTLICNHILAEDLEFKMWKVILKQQCASCTKQLIIFYRDHIFKINSDLTVEYDDFTYTADQAMKIRLPDASITKIGNVLIFDSHLYGFRVQWNDQGDVRINVALELIERIDGLCGFFNENPNDDKRKPDGSIAVNTSEFSDSWQNGALVVCEPETCPDEIQKKARELCQINHQALQPCTKVVNTEAYIARCMEKTCDCLRKAGTDQNAEDKCRCNALANYVVECLTIEPSIDLSDWRVLFNCPITCKSPFVYHDCYQRKCEHTCDTIKNPKTCSQISNVCFPGCYCPVGFVRKGETCVKPSECRDCQCNVFPNLRYITYDEERFTVNGKCLFVLSRDVLVNEKDEHKFQVLVAHEPCSNNKAKTCVGLVTVLYQDRNITISNDLQNDRLKLEVDGSLAEIINSVQVEETIDKNYRILLTDIQVEILVYYPALGISVKAPSQKYSGKLEGLCGNCDNNPKNDYATPTGEIITDINEFALSWLYENQDRNMCKNKEDVCPVPQENSCNVILDKKIFGQCHQVLDPSFYLEWCQKDTCDNHPELACNAVEAYAKQCANEGFCINWRQTICPMTCPVGTVYNPCGPSCPKTCQSIKEVDKTCSNTPLEGCFCPKGKVLLNNKCVDEKECQVCDDVGHRSGDKWIKDKCTTCSCEGTTVTCVTENCPLPPVCKKGFKSVKKPASNSECCDRYECIQEACDVNGVLKYPNETWMSADKCQTFSCEEYDGYFAIVGSEEVCPSLQDCPKESIYDDGCCRRCNMTVWPSVKCGVEEVPSQETIFLIAKEYPRFGRCENNAPISKFTRCVGTCSSSSIFKSNTKVFENNCSCCKPVKYSDLDVELQCLNGNTIVEKVSVPSECSCSESCV